MANPVFGTTTMHIAALFTDWGDEKARAFLDGMKQNGVRIASSNGEVKRLVANGEVAFGVADNDDANEALKEGAPVEVIYPDQDGMGTLLIPTSEVLRANPLLVEEYPIRHHAWVGRLLVGEAPLPLLPPRLLVLARLLPLGERGVALLRTGFVELPAQGPNLALMIRSRSTSLATSVTSSSRDSDR